MVHYKAREGCQADRKAMLAALIKKLHGDDVNLDAMFDVQTVSACYMAKRIIRLITAGDRMSFAASAYDVAKRIIRAASAYDMAKRIIRLITAVGDTINHDPEDKGPIQIAEETGEENLFIFGILADELAGLRATRKDFKTDPRFDELMADIAGGFVGDKEFFKPMVDSVSNMDIGNDWYLVANDFASYLAAQEKVDECYKDQAEWTRRSIMYTAGSGKFSSDRTIREYAEDIWDVTPARPQ
eukprot:gene25383-11044_t